MYPIPSSASAVTKAPVSSADGDHPQAILDLINHLLSFFLQSSLNIRSFVSRWQLLRSKFEPLRSILDSLSSSSHWTDNLLIQTLLPDLLSTLQRLKPLSEQCVDSSFSGGKLRMQSDLDVLSSTLSNHIRDLNLLLRSGVLQRQPVAVVSSQLRRGSHREDVHLFIRDIFTRLQIGGIEFKKKALESLLQLLSDDTKSVGLVVKEGNIASLIQLLELHDIPEIRDQAVAAVSILASTNDETRKCVFEGGGLGPMLRILDNASIPLKERAAIAVESITADVENAWAVSVYSGVSVLIEACRTGSPATQSHSAGAIRNLACVVNMRASLAEEGAVPVLVHLLGSSSVAAQEKAAAGLSILAESGGYFRALILQERGLQKLMWLVNNQSSSDVLESVLRAITSLSAADSVVGILSSSTAFIVQIGELIKQGSSNLQHLSATLLANLFVSDENKRAISSCMYSLMKLMECPKPEGLQDSAAQALIALLSVRPNKKELISDEKNLMRLIQMLDARNDSVPKKLPVDVVTAVLASDSHFCKQRLLAAGAHRHLQQLAEMEVPGASKAAQKLTMSRIKTIFSRFGKE
ncbi:hypothetical protein SAY86_022604 [Trapa natans]|uniref:DUF7032 domain-containing protein n=1 Tax=Trapa natans TaxID=22666 RepID=A0AAN7R4M0_TRANT|nr:hypothetical protein SAY86_022604 [Trapa natans]